MANDFQGYIQLSGPGIDGGVIDVGAAADLLAGIEKSLRFYIGRENPSYMNSTYRLPVKIERGSIWVFLIGLAGTGIVTVGTAYGIQAAKKLADNDVGQKTSKEVFLSALNKMVATTKIGKHRGHLGKEQIDNIKFKDGNQIIGIPNSKGDYLYVRRDELDAYLATPPQLFEPLARQVEKGVDLAIGVKKANGGFEEEKITIQDKSTFLRLDENTTDELIFPEMIDGMYVELEGELTRGNGRTNTVGFAYKDHILTCEPMKGSIKRYKDALFGKAIIKGRVQRRYKDSTDNSEDKKPRIMFSEIVALNDDKHPKLL